MRARGKFILTLLVSALISLNIASFPELATALTPAQTLDACIAAINDPLYTRSTIPGLTNFANAAAIETAIGNGSLVVYIASGAGEITGSASSNGNGRDFFCGDSNNNSVPSLDSEATTRDYFWGGGGNDSVSGTMWASTFWGGPGDDTVGTLSESSIFYGGPGNDSAGSITGGSTFEQGVDPDITAPTFPSSEAFNVAENSTAVGSITSSESATITIDAGADKLKFSLTQQTSTSATLAFSAAPDYESPTDIDANNSYLVVFKAVDTSNNAGYETVTVTVTNVVDTTSFSTFAIAGNVSSTQFRTPVVLTAVVTVSAKITFYTLGKRIANCINRTTTGSVSTYTATCTWKPTVRGTMQVTAVATPTTGGISGATSQALKVFVSQRSSTR